MAGTTNFHKRKRSRINTTINIIPMLDVMLVLVAILMIMPRALNTFIEIKLPEIQDGEKINNSDTNNVVINIDDKGAIYINLHYTEEQKLLTDLKTAVIGMVNPTILIRGSKNVSYGKMITILNKINTSGYKKVVLLTEPMQLKNKTTDVLTT